MEQNSGLLFIIISFSFPISGSIALTTQTYIGQKLYLGIWLQLSPIFKKILKTFTFYRLIILFAYSFTQKCHFLKKLTLCKIFHRTYNCDRDLISMLISMCTAWCSHEVIMWKPSDGMGILRVRFFDNNITHFNFIILGKCEQGENSAMWTKTFFYFAESRCRHFHCLGNCSQAFIAVCSQSMQICTNCIQQYFQVSLKSLSCFFMSSHDKKFFSENNPLLC